MGKNLFCSLGLAALLVLSAVTAREARAQTAASVSSAHQESQSLYKRLGGYDALAAVTDDFVRRLIEDKQLTRFFNGVSTDSRKRIRQLVVDQLCAATGGPCIYIGRSMKASHEGLGISESDWAAAVKHLGDTLDKFKVGKAEKDDLLKALTGLKPDIVESK